MNFYEYLNKLTVSENKNIKKIDKNVKKLIKNSKIQNSIDKINKKLNTNFKICLLKELNEKSPNSLIITKNWLKLNEDFNKIKLKILNDLDNN